MIEQILKTLDKGFTALQFGWDDGVISKAVKKAGGSDILIVNGAVEFDKKGAKAVIGDSRYMTIEGEYDIAFTDASMPYFVNDFYLCYETNVRDGGLVCLYNCDQNKHLSGLLAEFFSEGIIDHCKTHEVSDVMLFELSESRLKRFLS